LIVTTPPPPEPSETTAPDVSEAVLAMPDIDHGPEPDLEEIVDFHDSDIWEVTRALDAHDHLRVTALLSDLTAQDTAELIEKIDPLRRQKLLATHGNDIDPEVFTNLQDDILAGILEQMSPYQVASIVSTLESDDALGLIEPLDDTFRREVIRNLSAKTRVALEEGLSFPEDSAGRLMQREVVAVPQFWTVGKTIDYLHNASTELPESFFDLFIITPTHHIVGKLTLSRLVRAGRSEKIDTLVTDETYPVPATMDQEEVALLFKREDLTSAPVVDDDGRLLGVITVEDVVHVISDEAEEDFLKIAGVYDGDFYRTIKDTTKSRFYWLFINLITAILAAYVISFFEATITQVVALAVLMPIVAGMGGNAGTQTLTVAVRALATNELSATNMWRAVGKETVMGLLNGAAFAILIGIFAGLWFLSPGLGLVIAAAMVINMVVAGFFGAIIPITLNKLGYDPAESSAVFLTTFTDVIGFFAFLGLASIFLV
jgi:magnesium transporter